MFDEFLKENSLQSVFADAWNKQNPEDKFEDKLAKSDDEES